MISTAANISFGGSPGRGLPGSVGDTPGVRRRTVYQN